MRVGSESRCRFVWGQEERQGPGGAWHKGLALAGAALLHRQLLWSREVSRVKSEHGNEEIWADGLKTSR